MKMLNNLIRNNSSAIFKIILLTIVYSILTAAYEPMVIKYMFNAIDTNNLLDIIIIGVIAILILGLSIYLGYYTFVYVDIDIFKIIVETNKNSLKNLRKIKKWHYNKFDVGDIFERIYYYSMDSINVITLLISIITLLLFLPIFFVQIGFSSVLLFIIFVGFILTIIKTYIDTKIHIKLISELKEIDAILYENSKNFINNIQFLIMNELLDNYYNDNITLEKKKKNVNLKLSFLKSFNEIVTKLITTTQTIIIYIIIFEYVKNGVISIEITFATYVLVEKLDYYINGLTFNFKNVNKSLVSYDRYDELIKINEQIHDTYKDDVYIKITDLTLIKGERTILNNINLEINRNDKVLLQGHNGSGKTSLIKILIGEENEYTGSCLINGVEARELNISDKALIAYIPSKQYLFNDTVINNITLMNKSNTYSNNLLCKSFLNSDISELSTGQKQLVNVDRAINSKRTLLIADEPLANLNVENKELVIEHCFANFETLIFTMHSDLKLDMFNKIIKLNEGSIV